MYDFAADLPTFFNAVEFADAATLPSGAPITGIASTHAQIEKPGDASGSGYNPFLAGRADMLMQPMQFMTAWRPEYDGVTEQELVITSGVYAGSWLIRTIERDGDVARMILNKQ